MAPAAFVLVNAIAFYLLRPGVPDLWAARARASAVGQGVGLTYWFSWFGGATPGAYSVLTPFLSASLGTELLAGVAAVLACGFAASLAQGTRRPTGAAWVAALSIVVNLWCGRVPFVVGTAFALAALVFLRRRQKVPTAALTVLSVLSSPLCGAFMVLGLSGWLLVPRCREYRGTILLTGACAGGTLVALAIVFGIPGPEPFPLYLLGEIVLVLALMMLTAPPDHLRVTLCLSAAAALVLYVLPNGLGANFARLALFALPPAAVALSRRGFRTLSAVTAPILMLSALSSGSAVLSATRPSSTSAYYAPLAAELDTLHATNQRLELVDAAHAAYTALLGHAVLARGWETQQDGALNGVLRSSTLDSRRYKAWLDDNAVGYVAVGSLGTSTPEARAVSASRQAYLREIWSSTHWQLYEVLRSTSIVAAPAVLEASTPSAMTVQVPCACLTSVRIRWSKFLTVATHLVPTTPDAIEDTFRPTLAQDNSGWTTLTTNRAGVYLLTGAF